MDLGSARERAIGKAPALRGRVESLMPLGLAALAAVALGYCGLVLGGVGTFSWWLAPIPVLGLGAAALAGARWSHTTAAADVGELGRAVLELAPVGYLVVGDDGEPIHVNSAWHRLLGEAGLGAWPGNLIGGGAVGAAAGRLRAALDHSDSASEELEPEDESKPRLRLTAAIVPGAEGTVAWSLSEVSPPSPPLDQLIARIAPIIDSVPVGLCLTTREGQLTFVNATLADWLGAAPDDLTDGSTRLADLSADGSGRTASTMRLRARDGTIVAVRCASAELDGLGADTVCYAFHRSDAEADIVGESLEAGFHSLFDSAPVGLAFLDHECRVTAANIAFHAITGASEASEAGAPLVDLVDVEGNEVVTAHATAAKNGESFTGPVEVQLRGEGRRTAQLFLRAVGENAASGYVAYLIDLTEQKDLERQFMQSQKMQAVGQLAGGIAHDFNNLLTAMIGFCDLLLLRHPVGDQSFVDIMQIKQNANRAANLVRQLLAFSRQQTMQPRVLVLPDVLAELSHLLKRLLGTNIELKMVHGRGIGLVKVDQGQFEQVIINLAVNARDAMPDGGTLTIATRNVATAASESIGDDIMPAGDYVRIEVADNGCGMSPAELEQIFEPFFTTKEAGAGVGLGLSTVYGIIKQTGGFIIPQSVEGRARSSASICRALPRRRRR